MIPNIGVPMLQSGDKKLRMKVNPFGQVVSDERYLDEVVSEGSCNVRLVKLPKA